VNFGPLTPEITRLIFTHPKSIVRVLRMLMHLCAGHVTLLPGDFYPSKFLLGHLGRRADSGWVLPQISSVVYVLPQKNINNIFSTRDLRDAWADRREILHGGQY